MAIVPPNRKVFIDIRVVQESMDAHAKRMGISLLAWLRDTNWAEKETWGRHDPPSYPTDQQLYDLFIESLNNQHG